MKKSGLILGIGVILIMLTIIIPLPTQLIDWLLMAAIGFSVIFLLLSLFAKYTSLSWLPSILLVFTMFMLTLSVSAVRLILASGYAGEVIGTFGNFVGADNPIAGLIILVAVTAVSFIVIEKSTKKVSEVTAGLTTKKANTPLDKIHAQTAFCEAMFGVIKFAKGYAVSNIIMLFIIVVGGVAILGEAIGVFMLLAIGYGLVFLIPALLITLTSGLAASRV